MCSVFGNVSFSVFNFSFVASVKHLVDLKTVLLGKTQKVNGEIDH